jgi:hypothetical protein
MHLLAERNRSGLRTGLEDAGEQELIGRLTGGPAEGGEKFDRVIIAPLLRVHGDGGAPGDEVPVRHPVEQAAGVPETSELGVAAEEEVGEEEVRESFCDNGSGVRQREEAAEAVAGEA